MNYIVLNFECDPACTDMLIAELAQVDFDTFLETDTGFQASVGSETYDEGAVNEIVERYRDIVSPLSYVVEEVEKKNWNEEWEKHYDPIVVDDKCIVRASFHEPAHGYPYEIVINPKMSFGTGHHETTHLMLKAQLGIDFKGKSVLDLGCGTGILAIMAHKLGAKNIEACDIEEWAVTNSTENFMHNGCPEIRCYEGTVDALQDRHPRDIVLANINRNVLLEEIPTYSTLLNTGGYLLLSGFYEKDIPDIEQVAVDRGLKKLRYETKKDWVAVVFEKVN